MLQAHLRQMESDMCGSTSCRNCKLYKDREGNKVDCTRLFMLDEEYWKRSILEWSLQKGKAKNINPVFKIENYDV